ncbi:MAG TPA: DUF1592 domain-containing protein [Polyangiaceae bacterium]|nr:DUF1592 domain-containing protein [Polyangiaceae bacterium]
MRIASAVALLACIGCSAGNKLGDTSAPSSGGTGTGTGAGATGGSSMPGSGGGNMTSSGGSSAGGTGGSTSGAGGSTSGSGGSSGTTPAPGVGVSALAMCSDPNAIGVTPLRRLSQLEYANAARDLFGVTVPVGSLPSDELLGGVFVANIVDQMTSDQFTSYDTAAQTVADQVASNVAQASGCAASDGACIKTWLDGKARQAFHGVLEDADKQTLEALYDGIASSDTTLAASTAVHFILDSPRFLYVVEFGTASGTVAKLTPGEVAGRLATFLWRSVPDTALLTAADGGGLATADGVRTQATRMFQDAKAQPVLHDFIDHWLALSVSTGTDATAQAIDAETGDVFTAMAQGTSTYGDLFTTTQSKGNQALAQFYGVSVNADGTLTLPAERAGLLLRASFMRSHIKGDLGSPTQRGKIIRAAMLCDPVGPPGMNVDMSVAEPTSGQTAQDVFDAHANNPLCKGCHALMDPIGEAFGTYGPDGVYNTALATSTAGKIVAGVANTFAADFDSTAALLNILGTSEVPEQCFAIQTTRYALGRAESNSDACGLSDIWNAFKAANFNLQTLFVEVATSSLMQERNIVKAGEECQ